MKYQASSYDLDSGGWATTPDREFEGQDRNPFVAGEFVWTGFDYFGEPTPFDTGVARSSYFGIYDLCGFRKDRFYLYQSRWRPELPMAHLLPHWNWAERAGQVIPVQVYTSGDAAELFLNGKSLGLKEKASFSTVCDGRTLRMNRGNSKLLPIKMEKNGQVTELKPRDLPRG